MIDEKKLIEDVEKLKKIDEIELARFLGFMFGNETTATIQIKERIHAFKTILNIINAQPKISLENKTSDNDVPDTNVGKWIPIKHDPQSGWLYNLPDDGQEVLVCWSENGRITLDTFVNEGEDGCWWENGDPVEVGQAWKEKPEPYKGEEKA